MVVGWCLLSVVLCVVFHDVRCCLLRVGCGVSFLGCWLLSCWLLSCGVGCGVAIFCGVVVRWLLSFVVVCCLLSAGWRRAS